MARICELTGKGPIKGSHIWRSGKAKKSGGIGTHVTAITKRRFMPNLQRVKAVVDGEVRYIRVTAKGYSHHQAPFHAQSAAREGCGGWRSALYPRYCQSDQARLGCEGPEAHLEKRSGRCQVIGLLKRFCSGEV
jgi:large subunit ribosomal protein L28